MIATIAIANPIGNFVLLAVAYLSSVLTDQLMTTSVRCDSTDYDDIATHRCEAWNKLVDQPWKIKSIGMRDWAQRF